MWIYRPWITTKDGKRLYARNYGKKAFRIWVEEKSDKDDEELKSSDGVSRDSIAAFLLFMPNGVSLSAHPEGRRKS